MCTLDSVQFLCSCKSVPNLVKLLSEMKIFQVLRGHIPLRHPIVCSTVQLMYNCYFPPVNLVTFFNRLVPCPPLLMAFCATAIYCSFPRLGRGSDGLRALVSCRYCLGIQRVFKSPFTGQQYIIVMMIIFL